MNLNSILQRLRSVLASPIEELSKCEKIIWYLWRLVQGGAKKLAEDRAGMMAASLTYRTLFGILPITVVAAGATRSIMGVQRFELLIQDAIAASGLDQVKFNEMDSGVEITLGQWLSDFVASGTSVNIAAITWIGLFVLIYSAVSLFVNIESCFNSICGAKGGRSWLRRVPFYLAVLIVSPILFAVAMWVDSKVGVLLEWGISLTWLHAIASLFWNLLLAWLTLLIVYRLVPNTLLRLNSVMIGAFIAAVLLLIGKGSLGLYFGYAVSLHQLYGSIGLVPVFMFWMYLMWLIILLGLQVSAMVQQVPENK